MISPGEAWEALPGMMEAGVPKTTYKSYRYKARTAWSGTRRGVLSAPGKPDVIVGSPPEFRGAPDVWAPEELLLASVNTCIMLTFLTLAAARGLKPATYESEAEGLLENVDGKFSISEVTVRPHITVASETELTPTREAIARAESECFMSNSVKAQVKLVADVKVAAPR